MIKVKYSLMLLLLLAVVQVYGQASQNLSVGYNVGAFKATSINNFIRSYNDVNEMGKDGLSEVRFLQGISVGYQLRINRIYGEITYTKSFFGTSANLDFDEKRKMKMRNNEIGILGGGIIGSGDFKVNIGVGAVGMNSTIHFFVRQRDGSNSYGNERLLNGSYNALAFLGTVKVVAVKQISERMSVYGGIQFVGAVRGTSFAYNDDNIAKGAFSSANKGAYQLPEDYEDWLAIGSEEYSLQYKPFVEPRYTGLVFHTGVRYTFQ